MNSYEVKIYRDGEYVDTQVVTATREGLAITTAMAYTRVVFSGARASYEVTQLDTDLEEQLT